MGNQATLSNQVRTFSQDMDVVEQPCEYLGRKSSIQKELQGQEVVGEGSR